MTAKNIRFEVIVGTRRVSCEVSDAALEAAAGLVTPSTSTARRRSFDRFRTLINKAAQMKVARTGTQDNALVMLESEDLRHVPLTKGIPLFGSATRHSV